MHTPYDGRRGDEDWGNLKLEREGGGKKIKGEIENGIEYHKKRSKENCIGRDMKTCFKGRKFS